MTTPNHQEEARGLFPIQDGPAVPWQMAEIAYTHYVRLYGHGQSLQRLAERGGFGWYEFLHLYFDDARFNQTDEALRERWKTDVLKEQWEAETKAKHDLSSRRDQEIREVLEGLRDDGCFDACFLRWVKKYEDPSGFEHSRACLAARELYDQVQPVKEELDVVE